MKENYPSRIDRAKALLSRADKIVIGGGAGLSSAAGLLYSGKRFTDNFADFIRKYGMQDMYSAGFYPFRTQEEKWAYWSRHIRLNRFAPPALPLYRKLFALVGDKDYFVVTTNVDGQFEKAGFPPARIFAVQGDYGLLQCAKGCHDTLYDDRALTEQMTAEQADCRVPSRLVPKCPVCGGDMEVHIRKDADFVQDRAWYEAADRYDAFLADAAQKKTVLLELGVGYNTPTIIRFPFERLTNRRKETCLIRVNADFPEALPENAGKTVSFPEDIATVLEDLQQNNAPRG